MRMLMVIVIVLGIGTAAGCEKTIREAATDAPAAIIATGNLPTAV